MHELGATGPACWSCEISMFDLNLDEGLHINGGRISLPGYLQQLCLDEGAEGL